MAKKEITRQFKLRPPAARRRPRRRSARPLVSMASTPASSSSGSTRCPPTSRAKSSAVLVTVYKDRTFDIELKSPPASVLLKDAVKAEKGSGEPNKNKIGKITMAQCKAIAKEKAKELNSFDHDHAARIIAGTAAAWESRSKAD